MGNAFSCINISSATAVNLDPLIIEPDPVTRCGCTGLTRLLPLVTSCSQDSLEEHMAGFNTWGFTQNVTGVEEKDGGIVFIAAAESTQNVLALKQ